MSWSKTVCTWLYDVEDALLRMKIGIFRFVFLRLPNLAYRMFVDTIGPMTIQALRVAVLLALWLTILLAPLVFTIALGLRFWWNFGATSWLALAIGGSIWGLYYVVRKRRATRAEDLCYRGEKPSPLELAIRP